MKNLLLPPVFLLFFRTFASEMILNRLSILNYKNIREAQLELSPNMNCFIGNNGMGKTNVLDAVYFLSFCRSSSTPVDAQVICHDEPYCMIEGEYIDYPDNNSQLSTPNSPLIVSCGMKRGQKKHFKRNKKEYKRLSEHIGLIPLVVVSPSDTSLIDGSSEERRRLMDMVISQYDRTYMDLLSRYNNAHQQRNILLKQASDAMTGNGASYDPLLMQLWEEQMAETGEQLYAKRQAFLDELAPVFQKYYEQISGGNEQVGLQYVSHCQRGPLLEVIQRDRTKDCAVGYSLHGVHRDDLVFTINSHPMRREGSQGQNKTFVVSLKLAQFDFLKRASNTTPLLLLDDIFDKLDSSRVEQIIRLVSSDAFGQIFITDTNREHLDQILGATALDYRIFHVERGEIR